MPHLTFNILFKVSSPNIIQPGIIFLKHSQLSSTPFKILFPFLCGKCLHYRIKFGENEGRLFCLPYMVHTRGNFVIQQIFFSKKDAFKKCLVLATQFRNFPEEVLKSAGREKVTDNKSRNNNLKKKNFILLYISEKLLSQEFPTMILGKSERETSLRRSLVHWHDNNKTRFNLTHGEWIPLKVSKYCKGSPQSLKFSATNCNTFTYIARPKSDEWIKTRAIFANDLRLLRQWKGPAAWFLWQPMQL